MPVNGFSKVKKLYMERTFSVKNVVSFEPGDRNYIVARLTADILLCVACFSCFTISGLEPLAGGVPDTCESLLSMACK